LETEEVETVLERLPDLAIRFEPDAVTEIVVDVLFPTSFSTPELSVIDAARRRRSSSASKTLGTALRAALPIGVSGDNRLALGERPSRKEAHVARTPPVISDRAITILLLLGKTTDAHRERAGDRPDGPGPPTSWGGK
jgi:hypothetical protein